MIGTDDNHFNLLVKLFSNYGYEFSKSVANTISGTSSLQFTLGSNNPDEEIIMNSIGIKKSKNQANISGDQQKFHAIFRLNNISKSMF